MGLSFEEVNVEFEVPASFEHGVTFVFMHQGTNATVTVLMPCPSPTHTHTGHETVDGGQGHAELTVNYAVPEGIKVDFKTGQIEYKLEVPIDKVLKDQFKDTIVCPSGEKVEVN